LSLLEIKYRTPEFAYNIPPIFFMIGAVPIIITPKISVTLGARGVAKAANLGVSGNVNADFVLGAAWKQDGGWTRTSTFNPSGSGAIKNAGPIGELGVEIDVSPTFLVGLANIGFIGGGAKILVEAHSTVAGQGSSCAVPFVSTWGVFSQLSYSLGVTIAGKKFGLDNTILPTELYRGNIASGCLVNNKVIPALTVGTMWTGKVSAGIGPCPTKPTGSASAQLIEVNEVGKSWNVLMTVNSRTNGGSVDCVWQSRYTVALQEDGTVAATPFADANSSYRSCAGGSTTTVPNFTWKGTINAEKTKVTLSDTGNCMKLEMSR